MHLSAAPERTCAQGAPPVTAPHAAPGEDTGALWPRHSAHRKGVSAARTWEGPGHSSHPRHTLHDPARSSRPALRPVGLLGWAPNPDPHQPTALPVSEPPRAPSPGSSAAIPGLSPWPRAQHRARLSSQPELRGHLHACACPPRKHLPSPHPVKITSPSRPSAKATTSFRVLPALSPAQLAARSCTAWTPVTPVTQPAWPLAMSAVSVSLSGPGAHRPLGHRSPHANPHRVGGAGWEGGALPTACPAWAPLTCTPKMPKMMKKAQQMRTMLPMGLREEMSVSTTNFRPGARLMTLQAGGTRGTVSPQPGQGTASPRRPGVTRAVAPGSALCAEQDRVPPPHALGAHTPYCRDRGQGQQ